MWLHVGPQDEVAGERGGWADLAHLLDVAGSQTSGLGWEAVAVPPAESHWVWSVPHWQDELLSHQHWPDSHEKARTEQR